MVKLNASEHNYLQLLLFVDERPTNQENIQRIQVYLDSLKEQYCFTLEKIEIGQKPQLVEYHKLVATPALVKIFPLPRQTLAGSNLIDQLKQWWPQWQNSLQNNPPQESISASSSGEIIRLEDRVFILEKEKEELIEQLMFKDRILAMLAHDLRSPLTAASLAMETLELSEFQEESEKKRNLRKHLYNQSRKQLGNMKRLIEYLLKASKNVSAKLEIRPDKLDLKLLCLDVILGFSKQLNRKSQKITPDIPQDVPFVYGDRKLIRQLLVNLLDNAIKYTPEGGQISLMVWHRTSQTIQVSIRDNGFGIPPEKLEGIFKEGVRLIRDKKEDGYGLGLFLCRQIVLAHQGQIWVDSYPDKGSCFHFTLPVFR